KRSICDAHWIDAGSNLGCGGGLALAEKSALEIFGDKLTHVWILDDDALVHPDTLGILVDEMQLEHADVACPIIANEHGRVGWFPGLVDRGKFDAIREPLTPAEFVTRCGTVAIPFSWATGVSLLVSLRAIHACGFHRG